MSFSVVVGHVMEYLKCEDCGLYFFTPEGTAEHDKICIGYIPEPIPKSKPIETDYNLIPIKKVNINTNPPCPKCNIPMRKHDTVLRKKTGVKQIYRCPKCQCQLQLPKVM